jgi:hypothetical protein
LLGDVYPAANMQFAREVEASDDEGSRLAMINVEVLNDCFASNRNFLLWMRRYLALLIVLFAVDIALWALALAV